VDPGVLRIAARAREAAADGLDTASAQGSGCLAATPSRSSAARGRTSGWSIAGLRGFHAEALEKLRADLGLTGAVEFTGWIPRAQLYDLYRRAWAFLYPSTFEGFGMPVVEALAAGIPTGCSNIEPLSGIAGEAALQFEPGNVEAIYARWRGWWRMNRCARGWLLKARCAPPRFPGRATARATLDAIEDALHGARPEGHRKH
jgi:glycosyltransferase involved in cell wall biosynthesis